ncbi:MAG TPA: hypothetical protein VIX73_36665 [Kofleriaceae bacterium]
MVLAGSSRRCSCSGRFGSADPAYTTDSLSPTVYQVDDMTRRLEPIVQGGFLSRVPQ